MRAFKASLFVLAALALTHVTALPTSYRRQGGSSSSASTTSTASASASASTSVDFVCPPTDLNGVALSNSTVDGEILTCLYGKTDCSYALSDGNEVVEQDGSMMNSAPPPNCPLTANPSSGSSSSSNSSLSSLIASIIADLQQLLSLSETSP
ncbi:hypothetical protein C8R45DRAFT_1113177 [Mycena sanguinolenta]|nr:hypothetical protein C8R45DRAFT_1113177 [Mycena sanguinolenta]